MINNKQIALLHTAKKSLGLTEDDYRALLGSVGAESAKEMTDGQFDRVVRRLRDAGFRPVQRKKGKPKPSWPKHKRHMTAKIEAILKELKLEWSYADGIAKQMFGIERVSWLDPDQLFKVMAALIYRQWKVRKEKIVDTLFERGLPVWEAVNVAYELYELMINDKQHNEIIDEWIKRERSGNGQKNTKASSPR